jgi:histidinol-phosphate aminotransferase
LFEIDLEATRAAITPDTKIIFVSSPNNPTGNLAGAPEIVRLLEAGRLVVVDEAYFEFCDETAVDLVSEYDNLVVLRTMSKWAGLAGLRVGYGVMNTRVADHLMDIKPPYSVSVAAEAALLASLADAETLMDNVDRIVQERERLTSLLNETDGVTPWPSAGNFILCQFAPGQAGDLYEGLARRGVFVRSFSSPRLQDCFRVAVGTPAQGDVFIATLRELLADG